VLSAVLFGYRCFALSFSLLTSSHISQAVESVQVSWAFCENCLSVFCEFFSQHDSCTDSMGTSVPFTGAPGVVTAFFGYFF
jgi:hypothetical protein